MCGIIGTTKQLGEHKIDEMLSEIIHRGPDEAGTYFNDTIPAHMGARRLSTANRARNQSITRMEASRSYLTVKYTIIQSYDSS